LVPNKDVVIFIRLCADLLREKFPYDEILSMLGSNLENRALRDVVREIRRDLKMGKEGREVFLKHANVFGRFTAYMLSIASTSGNMAEIYENTAKFLQRSADFRKNVRGALFMPTIVLLFAFGALIFYVSYIFPEIAGLLLKYDIKVPPMTAATLATSEFLKKNFAWLSLPIGIPLTFLATYFRSERGRVLWHRLIISLPVVGKLIYKTSIEIFLRFFHALYSGSGENIHVIKLAAESCRNAYIEKQIKEQVIPCMLRQGRSFSEALEMFGVFPQDAIYSLRSGEESGALRESALSLANFYEKETTHKMARVIDLINLTLAVFISVVTAGITLLSSEIGFVSPPNPLGR
jgi:type IV pilus assembly protein PilC